MWGCKVLAEIYRFFDSTEQDPRQYPADHFAEFFRGIIKDGVQYDTESGLNVVANGINMTVTLRAGAAFIQGYQYILDEDMELTHDNPDASNRIDRIVLRLDRNPDQRKINAVIKKGIAGGGAPELSRTEYIYEYPLAQILIKAGQSYIAQSQVTIEAEKAKILNNKYRQIFIGTGNPDPTLGADGDIFIKYTP